MLTPINVYEEKAILMLRELPEDKKGAVLDFIDFLKNRSQSPKKDGEEYSYYLNTLRKKIREKGSLGLGKTREKNLQKLRKIRESVWKENYENHFGHQ